MTLALIRPEDSGDLTPYRFHEAVHRLPETTLVLPEFAPPAPRRTPVTRVYLPALTLETKPLFSRGRHRRNAPAWALLATGAGLALMALSVAGLVALAVLG